MFNLSQRVPLKSYIVSIPFYYYVSCRSLVAYEYGVVFAHELGSDLAVYVFSYII